MHVNPRYDENNIVVRKTRIDGHWGTEERSGDPFDIAKGAAVECLIVVADDVFKVTNDRRLVVSL